MKRILIILVAIFILGFVSTREVSAQVATQSGTTNVTVTVAGFQLSVSGYIAPYASVALTINGNVVTSVTADGNGDFSFTNIAIPKTTSTVCFDVVDYRQLGASQACITIVPVNGTVNRTNVFLPPTLGLQRTEVTVGSNALAFGYGMPGATINVHVNNVVGCTVVADKNGYYQCSILIQKAGSYELYADSVLNGKPSEQQLKKVLLKGLAVTRVPTLAPIAPIIPGLPSLGQIPWWGWLLLILIGIILLIILLRKLRQYIPALPEVALPGLPKVHFEHMFDFLFRERKLHHWWMKGVGF